MSFLTTGGEVQAGTGDVSTGQWDWGKTLLAGGTLLQAVNRFQGGRNAADIARTNAETMKQRAAEYSEATKLTQERLSRKRREVAGRQIAGYGKAGVELSGSPLRQMIETAEEIEKDIVISGYEGAKRSRKAAHQAKLLEWRADQRETAGTIRAGTTLLTGASKLFGSS